MAKVLYIVVEDVEDKREKERESFRYTRPVLQSTLQLMGCKARHAFKVPYDFRLFAFANISFFLIIIYFLLKSLLINYSGLRWWVCAFMWFRR